MHAAAILRSPILLVLLTAAFAPGCASGTDEAAGASSDAVTGTQTVAESRPDEALLGLPHYLTVPRSVMTLPVNRGANPYPTYYDPSKEVPSAGLRIIAVNQGVTTSPAPKPSEWAAKGAARRKMTQDLAASGDLQPGDIVLMFRPSLAHSLPYLHVQMGITHSSLAYGDAGTVFNMESPLNANGEYMTRSSQYDAPVYKGEDAWQFGVDSLHILRARAMSEPGRREQLNTWSKALKSDLERVMKQVQFQGDYLKPVFAGTTPGATVTRLGKIIAGQDSGRLDMYCSEFIWHMLALSSCTESQIRATPSGEAADCVRPVFDPMPLVGSEGEPGLGEGPLQTLALAAPTAQAGLINALFSEPAPDAALPVFSSGHRDVAIAARPLMEGLKGYYGLRAAGQTGAALPVGDQLNAATRGGKNYSPTSFLIQSMRSGDRAVDYVATVRFMSPTGFAAARDLARHQGVLDATTGVPTAR